jgi:hypothetical protein
VGLHDPDEAPDDEDHDGDAPVDEAPEDEIQQDDAYDDEALDLDEPAPDSADEPPAGATADAEDVPLFDTPAPRPTPRTGRPAVPSFDDILFGPGPKPQD